MHSVLSPPPTAVLPSSKPTMLSNGNTIPTSTEDHQIKNVHHHHHHHHHHHQSESASTKTILAGLGVGSSHAPPSSSSSSSSSSVPAAAKRASWSSTASKHPKIRSDFGPSGRDTEPPSKVIVARQGQNDSSASSSSSVASSNGTYPVSYDQPYRPQIHFSPSSSFMNDPNGLVVTGKPGNQTIHLYYQYNPTEMVAGNQHWGHATTKSFESYKWENHLPAISPKNATAEQIFSGSAVIDTDNTSGFFDDSTEPEDRVVAIYTLNTAAEQTQDIAYSTDGGYTFTNYTQNPVLRHQGKYQTQFRDPKVFWDKKHSQWVMAVAKSQEFKVAFYTSPNLKEWTSASAFTLGGLLGYQYECPGLFEAPVVGGPNDGETMWVLILSINPGAPLGGSINQYVLGDWDGKTFSPRDNAARVCDFGKDWYAAQTWDNTGNGSAIIGWASNWQYGQQVPTSPWRSVMSVPRQVTVRYAAYNPLFSDYVMAMTPFNTSDVALRTLSNKNDTSSQSNSSSNGNQTVALTGNGAFDISATFTMTTTAYTNAVDTSFGEFRIYATKNNSLPNQYLRIGLMGGAQGAVYIDRRKAGGSWSDENVFFTDRFSVWAEPLNRNTTDVDQSSDEDVTFKWKFHLIVDRSITEVFVNEGIHSAAVLTYWDQEAIPDKVELRLGDELVGVENFKVEELKSTWLSSSSS